MLYIKQKSNREKENQSRLLEQANSVRSSHESRLNQIQQQLVLLNEREGQLNQVLSMKKSAIDSMIKINKSFND